MGSGIDEACRRCRTEIKPLIGERGIPKGDMAWRSVRGFGLDEIPHVPKGYVVRSNGHEKSDHP